MSEPSSPDEAAKEFVRSLVRDPSRPLWEAVAQAFRERDRAILAVAESLWENPLPYLATLRSKVLGE